MFSNEDEELDEENEGKEGENVEDIKVILVGEPGTGKTSLINVSVGEAFKEVSQSTLLSTFVPKTFNKNGHDYILNIWDTAGQEKYRAMTKIFIKNSKIVIFVYAIDNLKSFEGLKKYWVNSIKEALGDVPILGMVGNKCDLFMKEEVKEEDAKQFALEKKMKFELVSAKEDPDGFIKFLSGLLDDYLAKNNKGPGRKTIHINKDNNSLIEKSEKKCC